MIKPKKKYCVEKLRTSRPCVFATDLNLHSYELNECCAPPKSTVISSKTMSDLQQTPSVKTARETASISAASDSNEYEWKWLQDVNNCQSKCIFRVK